MFKDKATFWLSSLLGRGSDDRINRYSYEGKQLLPHRPAKHSIPMVYADYHDRVRKHNARAAADAIYNNADELVNNPAFNARWNKAGTAPNNQPSDFSGKYKCNLFNHYVNASTFAPSDGTNKHLINVNRATGNLINASLLNRMFKNPSSYKNITSGKIFKVPAHLAPFAKGAVASSDTHMGIVMGDGTTASAGDKLGAVRNDWGFRGNEKNMQYAYILPEGVDGDVLLEDAKKRRQEFINGLLRKIVNYK